MTPAPEPPPDDPTPAHDPKPRRFPRRARMSLDLDFQAAKDARLKKSLGPLMLFARPNGLSHHRLGLAVGRAVGHAVRRHRFKRLLREAFRLEGPTLPMGPGTGYDLLISVRPHDEHPLAWYRRTLRELLIQADQTHRKRLGEGGS